MEDDDGSNVAEFLAERAAILWECMKGHEGEHFAAYRRALQNAHDEQQQRGEKAGLGKGRQQADQECSHRHQ